MVLVAVLLVALACLAAILVSARHGLSQDSGPALPNRVAVLAFDTLNHSKELAPFCDALAEQIIGVLNENQVQAVSRAQTDALRGPGRDHGARALGADFILDGTAQKISDGRKTLLRVTVHLDHASTHTTLWTETFEQDGSDSAGLQSQVAARAVDEIKAALKAAVTQDDAAIAAYLLAQKYARQGGPTATALRRDQMRIVVARAPDFSPGYSGLAAATAQLVQTSAPAEASVLRQEAEKAIAKALALDPQNGEAFFAKSYLASPWNYAEQEEALRQGLKIEPDEPSLNSTLAAMLEDVGRISEALSFQQRAVMLDPLSPRKTAGLAILQAFSGNPAQAHETIKRASALWPGVWRVRLFIAGNYGYADEAVQILQAKKASSSALEPDVFDMLETYQKALAATDRAAKESARAKILASYASRHAGLDVVIEFLVRLGYIDDAFDVLDKAYSGPAVSTSSRPDTAALFRPATAALRKDKRFAPLVARLGFIAYWKAHKAPDFCAQEAVAPCPELRLQPSP
jgi:Predicted integral membrane protein